MLLNIIHPHTFRQVGDTLMIGPYEPYKERDEKVSAFVTRTLDSGKKVISNNYSDGYFISDCLRRAAFLGDPLYTFLSDERIDTITTPATGTPIPDKRPEAIPVEYREALRQIYISHSDLKGKVGGYEHVIFIGGFLGNCVTNAAAYFHQHYRKSGQQLFYIPELCVSFREKDLAEVKPKLDERDIRPLDYEEAMDLISCASKPIATQIF